MSDYAEPLIVIKELHRKAREAMQEKQWVNAIACIDGILAQACLARAEAIAQLEKKAPLNGAKGIPPYEKVRVPALSIISAILRGGRLGKLGILI